MSLLVETDCGTSTRYFSAQDCALIDFSRIPHHVAFIMDGNRRWAKKGSMETPKGHRQGAEGLIDIIKASKELGIRVMTLYVFSTENWNRSQEEVLALMWLFESYIRNLIPTMIENGMRFDTIGNLSEMPEGVNNAVREAKEATENCEDIEVVFAMNYGARDELCRAFKKMIHDHSLNKLSITDITEQTVASYLDTKNYPDPDLVVRTGGEQRISNFLLWQASYSELYVTDVLWPDFSPQHLLETVKEFQRRDRRLGQ